MDRRRRQGIFPSINFSVSEAVDIYLSVFLQVGLGTDVSGGYSPSMLTAIQHASMASKVITIQAALPPCTVSTDTPPSPASTPAKTLLAMADTHRPCLANKPLPTAALLHMATLGGAELCSLETHTGSFAPGKAFDALLVNLLPEAGNPQVWWDSGDNCSDANGEVWGPQKHVEDLEASLEKFLFCGDDRNIFAVFVEGKLVGGQQFVKVAP
jgi:guanine deaminase